MNHAEDNQFLRLQSATMQQIATMFRIPARILGDRHSMKHTKTYRGLENGAGKIICSCGFETPAVDDSAAFTLGTKQRSVESYFEEHLAEVNRESGVETTMVTPAKQTAVTAAQKPQPKKRR